MTWFWEHGNQLFIFFAFPLIGLGFDFFLSKKMIVSILATAVILLSPILTGYSYIIPGAIEFFALIIISCVYSFYSRLIEKRVAKVITSIVISGLLFVMLAFAAFMDSFSGSIEVKNKWDADGYKIEYIEERGFSGRPLLKYELSKYGIIPIFIKNIETSIDNDTVPNCNIQFTKSEIVFDKCNGTITSDFNREPTK